MPISDATNRELRKSWYQSPPFIATFGYGGRPSYTGWSLVIGLSVGGVPHRPKLQRLGGSLVSSLKELEDCLDPGKHETQWKP